MENFENELQQIFNQNIELPIKYQYMIRNTLKNKKTVKNNKKSLKILVATCSCVLIMTSIAFAKAISLFFTNTTESIDTATQNGYVQNLNEEFIYSNGLGIRISSLIMDDSTLDISYEYNFDKEMDTVELDKYVIQDNNENLFYQYDSENYSIDQPLIVTEVVSGKDQYNSEKVEEGIWTNSVIYKSSNFPKSESLLITINRVKINNTEIIEGEWILEIALDDKFIQREKSEYVIVNPEHILKSEITLSETTLKVYLEIDTPRGDNKFLFENPPTLKNTQDESFLYSNGTWNNQDDSELEGKSVCTLEFDLSKYNDDIEKLYLKIPVNEDCTLEIELEGKN